MFFFLSKTLDILLMPLTWVTGLILVFLLIRNKGKAIKLLYLALAILYLCSNYFIVNYLANLWEVQPKVFPTTSYDLGIVLTGVTDGAKTPKDRVYFMKGAERITTPLEMYKKGILRKILITGGSSTFHKNHRQSADVLKQFLIDHGVDDSDIIVENQALNTRENAAFTNKMLQKLKLEKASKLLITSAFHMRRSKACFQKEGISCDLYPVSYYGSNDQLTLAKFIIPDAHQLHICTKLIREIFGFCVYKIMGYA